MGISAFLLFKKRTNIPASDILSTLEQACTELNLFFDCGDKKYDNQSKLKYVRTFVSDVPFREDYDRQLCISLYDEPYDYHDIKFEWYNKSEEFFMALDVEEFYQNEDLMLKILLALLKSYPQSKLWIEQDWFYTLKDLEKVNERIYDNDWCYISPSE